MIFAIIINGHLKQPSEMELHIYYILQNIALFLDFLTTWYLPNNFAIHLNISIYLI